MEFVGDGIIDGNIYRSENNAISAAGTTQGTATALTADFNNVTTVAAGSGVVLPALNFNAIAGTTAFQAPHLFVVNSGANALLLYPPVGGTIDGGATNTAITIPADQEWAGIMTAALTWKTVDEVINGTANQINVSVATAGALVLGLASPLTMPGTLTLVTGSATVTPLEMVSGALNTTPVAGALEFNGQNLYFSSVTSQRAEVETAYIYRSNTATTIASATNTFCWLGNAGTALTTGVTLQASTVYEFEGEFEQTFGATPTTHTESTGFTLNGGLTITNLFLTSTCITIATTATVSAAVNTNTSGAVVAVTATNTTTTKLWKIKGTISVNAGGSLLPIMTYSATTGQTTTIPIGAWFRIKPIGPAGQISVGTWS